MRSKLIASGVAALTLALPGTALAGGIPSTGGGSGGTGQAQLAGQWAATLQAAQSQAQASQNAVNTNAPSTVAGGDVSGGSSNATQNAVNGALSAAANNAQTGQTNTQSQNAGSGAPVSGGGSGGTGQAQQAAQAAATLQDATSQATAAQNAVNANAPKTVAGGDVSGGSSNATQNAGNGAASGAFNNGHTDQSNSQSQNAGGSSAPAPVHPANPTDCSSCGGGSYSPPSDGSYGHPSDCSSCGGSYGPPSGGSYGPPSGGSYGSGGTGQFQGSQQKAATLQKADSKAKADQNAVNANAPVTVAGGDVTGGSSNASQNAGNLALSGAANNASTDQTNTQTQTAAPSSCIAGCGGTGQAQLSGQDSLTGQLAASRADAKSNTVNANVPVTIAGGDVTGGSSNATQNALNLAGSGALNNASTTQDNTQTQNAGGGGSCLFGCGGNGQAQLSAQKAATLQGAFSAAGANQNAVNANVPVTIAGGDVYGGSSNATQNAGNGALSGAFNNANTSQSNTQTQNGGGGGSCIFGCGGNGQAQLSAQKAATLQGAFSAAGADQNAVNANVPVAIAGGDVIGGSSNATQNAGNGALSGSFNNANTSQSNTQTQNGGGGGSCIFGCGGSGQAQLSSQEAYTLECALSAAEANQNAVNANTPVTVAGGDVFGGSSNAGQFALNGAGSLAGNNAGTGQNGGQDQS